MENKTFYIITLNHNGIVFYLNNDYKLGVDFKEAMVFSLFENAQKLYNEIQTVQYSPYLMKRDKLGKNLGCLYGYTIVIGRFENGSYIEVKSTVI